MNQAQARIRLLVVQLNSTPLPPLDVSSIAQGKDLTKVNIYSIFYIECKQRKQSAHALDNVLLPDYIIILMKQRCYYATYLSHITNHIMVFCMLILHIICTILDYPQDYIHVLEARPKKKEI